MKLLLLVTFNHNKIIPPFPFDSRLTSSVYRVVSVALFAHHQLMFSFMLATSIMRANVTYYHEDQHKKDVASHIQPREWTVFLQGRIMASIMSEKDLKEYDGKLS